MCWFWSQAQSWAHTRQVSPQGEWGHRFYLLSEGNSLSTMAALVQSWWKGLPGTSLGKAEGPLLEPDKCRRMEASLWERGRGGCVKQVVPDQPCGSGWRKGKRGNALTRSAHGCQQGAAESRRRTSWASTGNKVTWPQFPLSAHGPRSLGVQVYGLWERVGPLASSVHLSEATWGRRPEGRQLSRRGARDQLSLG